MAFLVMLAAFEMASVAQADECLKGVLVPTRRVMLRGRRISRVMITSVEPPALLVFDGVGLACEGPAQLDDRHVTARVRMCVADDLGPGIPRCWCSPSMVDCLSMPIAPSCTASSRRTASDIGSSPSPDSAETVSSTTYAASSVRARWGASVAGFRATTPDSAAREF
jgi:hypothetical protein